MLPDLRDRQVELPERRGREVRRHRVGLLQTQVVLPPLDALRRGRRSRARSGPSGTVMLKSYVALSRGLSLHGYQAGEPCGSLTTNAPSSVGTQPSIEPSGSVTTPACRRSRPCGEARARRRSRAGVTVSSCPPSRVNVAARPLTSSREIASPRRSRLKLERSCVAFAVITAVAAAATSPVCSRASGRSAERRSRRCRRSGTSGRRARATPP